MSTPPRFNISDAQRHFTAPVNKANIAIDEIKREHKLAKIKLAGTYVGIVLGAATTAYVLIKKQSKTTEED
jgi:hypothetical protein